jgi:N-acetylglucosamine kinase-like BadF-type ATPase
MSDDLILGIDGGGTKTVAWIARAADPRDVLGRGAAGPANPQVVGADTCVAQMDQAIDAAFADAELTRQPFAAACIGLAGADRKTDRAKIQAWATHLGLTKQLRVVNDALPVLHAASPAGCGIAVIAGTGSFVFGRREDGTTARAGGWGYLFGDEGSGYAIALDGLRAAARAADGRGPATVLLEQLLAELGRTRGEELITAIYDPSMSRDRIAALSRVVFDAGLAGDNVAAAIIDSAADSLAETVAAVAAQLAFGGGEFPLALAGGVLLNRSEVRDELQRKLRERGLHADPVVTVADPVAGALIVAGQSVAARGR